MSDQIAILFQKKFAIFSNFFLINNPQTQVNGALRENAIQHLSVRIHLFRQKQANVRFGMFFRLIRNAKR